MMEHSTWAEVNKCASQKGRALHHAPYSRPMGGVEEPISALRVRHGHGYW